MSSPRLLLTALTAAFTSVLGASEVRADAGVHERLENLSRAIEASPCEASLYLRRAELEREHGDLQSALRDHCALLAGDTPAEPDSWLANASLQVRLGLTVDALLGIEAGLSRLGACITLELLSFRHALILATLLAVTSVPRASAQAQLVAGDGDEVTVVGQGPSAADKYRTTYFRHSFVVADASAILSLWFGVLRDDRAVVVRRRTNLPSDSRVDLGPAPGSLSQSVIDPAVTVEHEVSIASLSADTTYAYAVDSSAALLAGDDVGAPCRTGQNTTNAVSVTSAP